MPFRQNAFREQIAQPGTTWSDIDDLLIDKHALIAATPYAADIFRSGDDDFKFGGTLYISGECLDEGEQKDAEINFDGFETFEDAKAWVVSLDDVSFDINEVD